MTGMNENPGALLPELLLVFAAVVGLLAGSFLSRDRQGAVRSIAVLACVAGVIAAAADLTARQLWWVATVGVVGLSLWIVVFMPGRIKWAALLLLPLPYLYGAPLPSAEPGSMNPALVTLHQQFVWATAGTNLLLWLILGVLSGGAMQRWIDPALVNAPRRVPARA